MKAYCHGLQDKYPELLEAKLFLNVPAVTELKHKIQSVFSTNVAHSKLRFVSSHKTHAVMREYISPDQLPAAYGGFQQEDLTWQGVRQVTSCTAEIYLGLLSAIPLKPRS